MRPGNRAVVADLLTPLGFEVIEAAIGSEGLESARSVRPDLILMDIAMPHLDGLAAGMNAVLPKPLDADKLLDQMALLLRLNWTYRAAQALAEVGAMVLPPTEEMDVLYRLARLGNMQEIIAQADRLAALDERYCPFANHLTALAKGYQSKAVLRLMEAHRQGTLLPSGSRRDVRLRGCRIVAREFHYRPPIALVKWLLWKKLNDDNGSSAPCHALQVTSRKVAESRLYAENFEQA